MKGLAVVPILLILRNFLNNMVSIVICNRGNRISPVLEKNISETIGIEYEVVCIDNSKNQYNIFQAYNIGVAKARYPLICFMHYIIQLTGGKNCCNIFRILV